VKKVIFNIPAMVKLPNDERVVIVALGESGSGKSNILNLILNTPGEQKIFFPEGEGAEPCTLNPQEEVGCWRGDPGRQITVFDTPGLSSEDGVDADLSNLRRVSSLIKDLSYINCFLIVVRSGQSRFLAQHQKMFESLEAVFGTKFWQNVVFDIAGDCNGRDRKNLERWIAKLGEKFPNSMDVKQVYMNTTTLELDTLEELWQIIDNFSRYSFASPVKPDIRAPTPDILLSSRRTQSPDVTVTSSASSRSSSRLGGSLTDIRSRSDYSPSRYISSPSRIERPSILDLPYMPPLPPRSPTHSRRRSAYQPPRSVTSTPRLPRSFMPSMSLTEDFSTSKYSSTPRFGRRSYRETSPILSSYSCRSSREPSPDVCGSRFKTVGIPTYLRTCNAYSQPFTKAMRASRLELSHASEDRILLEGSDPIPYPDLEDLDAILRLPYDPDLMSIGHQSLDFIPLTQTSLAFSPPVLYAATTCLDTTNLLISLPWEEETTREEEEAEEICEEEREETFKAKKVTTKDRSSELMKPDTLVVKNPYNYVKRALLPKVKYHWDQGFRQGTTGWEKVPVIKLKVKYNEEDKEVLPAYISVEGGRWCESKRLRMEGGHKAKCKLRATQGPEFQIRVVPLDRDQKQESWVPEFIVSILSTEGKHLKEDDESKKEEGEKEKWIKAHVTPCTPE